MRIVADTNVVIAALFEDDGWCEEIFARDGIDVIANEAMLNELEFLVRLHIEEYQDTGKADIARIERIKYEYSEIVRDITIIPHNAKTDYCKADRSDNKFIDCAIDGSADYLITSNYLHLFGYESNINREYKKTITFLRPSEFIKELNRPKIVPKQKTR